jgi:PIN domain nuclease of toxin-antitoxin system
MKLLIDSQALIWYVDQDHLLSRPAHAAISDSNNQALTEGMDVVSSDAALDPYGVKRLW